jgi:prepilin-type N-terminal cleavage/methylation domain-containing protein
VPKNVTPVTIGVNNSFLMPANAAQKGFSLIEAVMVISIVAMLAAVAVPSLMSSKDAAEKAALMVTLRTMHTDQTAYHTTNARYARLSELNTYAGGYYGTIVGTTLRHKNWIFLATPTPTNSTLRSQYQFLAYRMNKGRISSAYLLAQDGVATTLVP